MKFKHRPLLFLIIILLLQPVSYAEGLTQGDYNLKFWGGGLNIWLSYPEDASPGDTLTYDIYVESGKFARGNQVELIQLQIICLGETISTILYDNTLLSNSFLDTGETINQTIQVTLPPDARWRVSVKIDTISYEYDYTNRQESHVIHDATTIRTDTYLGLLEQNQYDQIQLEQMTQKYNELKTQLENLDTNTTDSEYLTLMQNYQQLSERYNLLLTTDHTGQDVTDLINDLNENIQNLQETLSHQEEANTQLLDEIDRINADLQDETTEKESIVTEFETYKETYTITQAEIDSINQQNSQNNTIKNGAILAVLALSIYTIVPWLQKRMTEG